MTKLLDEAIDQLRELPDEEQDAAADALFAYIANDDRVYSLRPDQVADVRRIRDSLAAGKTQLATDRQVEALRNSKRA
jgi:hypothetical protein